MVNVNSLEEIIAEIKRYKGIFIPEEHAFIDFIFRYSCRILELYHVEKPKELLRPLMIDQARRTLVHTKNCYWKYDTHNLIYVPDIESIDDLLNHDIKDGFQREIVDRLLKEREGKPKNDNTI